MTDAELDELERMEGQASPGPWHATDAKWPEDELCGAGAFGSQEAIDHHNGARWTVSRDLTKAGWTTDGGCPGYGICEHDARFIAAARDAVPKLIAEIRRLRERDEMRRQDHLDHVE